MTSYGGGNQCALWLDGIVLSDPHIGPWIIGNPFVLNGANGAYVENGTIENIYSELSASTNVFGASGLPYAIGNLELHNVTVQSPRQYFTSASFAGSARIFKGIGVNCKFISPQFNKIGANAVSTDKLIELTAGSLGNYVDMFDVSSVVGSVTTHWYTHPSQHVTTIAGATRYNDWRKIDYVPVSLANGTTYATNGDKTVATIPFLNLNCQDMIKIRIVAKSTVDGAATVRAVALINGTSVNSGAIAINSAVGTEATLDLELFMAGHSTGSVDKAYDATATALYYWAAGESRRGNVTTAIASNTNAGAYVGPIDITANNLVIALTIAGVTTDTIEFVGAWIEHRSARFSL